MCTHDKPVSCSAECGSILQLFKFKFSSGKLSTSWTDLTPAISRDRLSEQPTAKTVKISFSVNIDSVSLLLSQRDKIYDMTECFAV